MDAPRFMDYVSCEKLSFIEDSSTNVLVQQNKIQVCHFHTHTDIAQYKLERSDYKYKSIKTPTT